MPISLPANPRAIELSFRHNRPWWSSEGRDRLQHWQVSADVNHLLPCGEVFRHVADLGVDVIDLTQPLDSDPDNWGSRYAAECVADHQSGRLHPDLEEWVSRGGAQAVVLRSITVSKPWRGHRLAELLTASMLRFWARSSRLALCRIRPEDFADECPDPVSAELAATRLSDLVERLGFVAWRDGYVGDLASPALRAARESMIQLWWPDRNDPHA